MTAPVPAPSSVGRYVRAVIGVLLLVGDLTLAVVRYAIHGAPVATADVLLGAGLLVSGYLLIDPTALAELPALIRAWRGTTP